MQTNEGAPARRLRKPFLAVLRGAAKLRTAGAKPKRHDDFAVGIWLMHRVWTACQPETVEKHIERVETFLVESRAVEDRLRKSLEVKMALIQGYEETAAFRAAHKTSWLATDALVNYDEFLHDNADSGITLQEYLDLHAEDSIVLAMPHAHQPAVRN